MDHTWHVTREEAESLTKTISAALANRAGQEVGFVLLIVPVEGPGSVTVMTSLEPDSAKEIIDAVSEGGTGGDRVILRGGLDS